MLPINFPNDPIDGQYFTVEGIVYKYQSNTNSWAAVSGEAGEYARIFFGTMPPAPASNNLWWNTETAELYVFYQDGSSNQWVISTPTPTAGFTGSRGETGFVGSEGSLGYTGSIGFTGSEGTGYDGSKGDKGDTGFTGSAGTNGINGYAGSRGFTGSAAPPVETFIVSGTTSGTITADISVTNVIELSPTGPFNIDIIATGRIFTNGTTNIIILINQSATPIIPSILLDGGPTTVLWQGGAPPTGNASKLDVISLTVLRSALGYKVLGQLVSFG